MRTEKPGSGVNENHPANPSSPAAGQAAIERSPYPPPQVRRLPPVRALSLSRSESKATATFGVQPLPST